MSNLTHSNGNGTGYGNVTLLMNPELCTLQTCDLSLSSFLYLPTIPGNAVYAGIFGLLLVGQLYLGVRYKTWGYMIAILLGLVRTIISVYICRRWQVLLDAWDRWLCCSNHAEHFALRQRFFPDVPYHPDYRPCFLERRHIPLSLKDCNSIWCSSLSL